LIHFYKSPKMAMSLQRVALRGLQIGRAFSNPRFLSLTASRQDQLECSVDPKGYTVISMNNGPANSLSLEFLQELTQAVKKAETESKGIVLTSSLNTIFCAGLDITEMYKPDEERIRVFWGSLQDAYLSLYGCKVPTVAAINGHSPAGGCLLAMCCDYRVMVGPKFSIGLNETQLGIVAPWWFKDTMLQTVGNRQTELALILGTLFSTPQALSIGMIDKMVDSKEEALQDADKLMTAFMRIPSVARHTSKMLLRQETYDRLSKTKEEDITFFADFIVRPEIQVPMGKYLEALKNKKKK